MSTPRDHILTGMVALLIGFIGGYYASRHDSGGPPRVAQPADGVASGQPAPSAEDLSPAARRFLEQIQALEAAFAAAPDDMSLALQLANAYYDVERYDRARALYETVRAVRPDDPDILTDLGVCYRNLREPEKALALFEEAARNNPQHWQSQFNQAVIHGVDRGDRDRADEILTRLAVIPEAAEAVTQLRAMIAGRSGAP